MSGWLVTRTPTLNSIVPMKPAFGVIVTLFVVLSTLTVAFGIVFVVPVKATDRTAMVVVSRDTFVTGTVNVTGVPAVVVWSGITVVMNGFFVVTGSATLCTA